MNSQPSSRPLADPPFFSDVIAGIATPAGEGGIGIVRLSGASALEVADRIFESPKKLAPSRQKAWTAQYGHVVCPSGAQASSGGRARRIDEVVLLVMRAPQSYTREDVVEINCHGGRAATQQVLRACIAAGARCAEPGEFTKRAFLNGRIDLIQAEGVLSVIRAKTDKALEAAARQLQGGLSVRVRGLRDALAHTLSHIEASLDFPDDAIEPMRLKEMIAKTSVLVSDIETLARYGRHARWVRDGIRVVLTGEPNVGKSSLMNRISQKERVIVSPHPGTTRDTVEETLEIGGYPVVLTDTAGIRETGDPIESQSVERSVRAAEEADLVLFVVDASRPPSAEECAHWRSLGSKPRRLILNKSDAASAAARPVYAAWAPEAHRLETSCKTGEGIESLVGSVSRFIRDESPEVSDEIWVYSVRQQELFHKAARHAAEGLKALESGLSPEFAASDFRLSMDALGEVVGAVVTDDILDLVFSQFCIGK